MSKKFLILLSVILLFVGCSSPEQKSAPKKAEQTNSPPTKYEVKTEDNTLIITLNEAEKKAYDNYCKTMDSNMLKELTPLTIGKIFVTAYVSGNTDVTYSLYTTRKGYVLYSKEKYLNGYKKRLQSKETNGKDIFDVSDRFAGMDQAEFKEINDFKGYLTYSGTIYSEATPPTITFKMIKDDAGIWKVAFDYLRDLKDGDLTEPTTK